MGERKTVIRAGLGQVTLTSGSYPEESFPRSRILRIASLLSPERSHSLISGFTTSVQIKTILTLSTHYNQKAGGIRVDFLSDWKKTVNLLSG